MADFHIKTGDLLPELQATLVDEDDAAIDLTAATSVKFIMKQRDGVSPKVDAAAQFVDKVNGVVKYTWQGTDTDTEGVFFGEFEVTWTTSPETYPNNRYIIIQIKEGMG